MWCLIVSIPDLCPLSYFDKQDSPTFSTQTPLTVVGQQRQAVGGCSSISPISFCSSDLSHQFVGLGSSSRASGPHGLRNMASTGISSVHQQPGDKSCQTGPLTLQGLCAKPLHNAIHGQHDSSSLHSRGHSL